MSSKKYSLWSCCYLDTDFNQILITDNSPYFSIFLSYLQKVVHITFSIRLAIVIHFYPQFIWLSARLVVYSYDLTTCPSWVQVPIAPCAHTYDWLLSYYGLSKSYWKPSPSVVQVGLDQLRLLWQRRSLTIPLSLAIFTTAYEILKFKLIVLNLWSSYY